MCTLRRTRSYTLYHVLLPSPIQKRFDCELVSILYLNPSINERHFFFLDQWEETGAPRENPHRGRQNKLLTKRHQLFGTSCEVMSSMITAPPCLNRTIHTVDILVFQAVTNQNISCGIVSVCPCWCDGWLGRWHTTPFSAFSVC